MDLTWTLKDLGRWGNEEDSSSSGGREDGLCERASGREQGPCAKSGDLAASNKADGEPRDTHQLSPITNDLNARKGNGIFFPAEDIRDCTHARFEEWNDESY